jgi:Fe-S cluster assembly protein SufB
MSTITKTSQKTTEPIFIQKIRLEAQQKSKTLSQSLFPYGLGIFASVPKERTISSFENNPISYDFLSTELSSGVKVSLWKDSFEVLSHFEKYFERERLPLFKNCHFAASFATFTSGLVIVAEEGVKGEISLKSRSKKNTADFIFIIAKRGASLRVVDTVCESGDFFARTMYVVAEEGANMDILSSQNLAHENSFFANKFSSIFRGGKISWIDAHFGGGFVKSDIEDFLLGEGAESQIKNITIAGNQNFDFYNASHHQAPHTTSSISARGIAAGGGKIIYRGLVDIAEDCPASYGTQTGRFLLASSGAEIDAIPSLDIRSPEVVSSHAFSINHLKESDFFYPALHGMDPYRAQAMIFEGFLSHDILEENILSLIRKKLSSQIYEIT